MIFVSLTFAAPSMSESCAMRVSRSNEPKPSTHHSASGRMISRILATSHSLSASIRSEEHTYELQSLMRISYAVYCLKKKENITTLHKIEHPYTQHPLNTHTPHSYQQYNT